MNPARSSGAKIQRASNRLAGRAPGSTSGGRRRRGDPLVQAAATGDMAAVRALVTQGHDVNAAGPDGATALHWAVRADDVPTVDALIRAGARVDVRNALGVPPVYVAAQNGNAELLRRLLDARADVNAADATGDTLLMAAVRSDSRTRCGCSSSAAPM